MNIALEHFQGKDQVRLMFRESSENRQFGFLALSGVMNFTDEDNVILRDLLEEPVEFKDIAPVVHDVIQVVASVFALCFLSISASPLSAFPRWRGVNFLLKGFPIKFDGRNGAAFSRTSGQT